MEIDYVAVRKLLAGIVAILLASGVLKWRYLEGKKSLKILLYIIGFLLISSAIAYQFDIILEEKTDILCCPPS